MPQRPLLREILARDAPAMLAAAIATIALLLGVFFLTRARTGEPNASLAALAAGAAWVALAGSVLAAGGRTWLPAVLRGGIVADASGVALVVIWLLSPHVTFVAAIKIYCIYTACALLGVAAVCCARTAAGKYAAAVLAAAAIMLVLASPFWAGGIVRAAGRNAGPAIAAAAVHANPFYSITAAVFEQTHFSWNTAPVMYNEVQQIGSPAPRWYSAAAIHATAAVLLAAIALMRQPERSPLTDRK